MNKILKNHSRILSTPLDITLIGSAIWLNMNSITSIMHIV